MGTFSQAPKNTRSNADDLPAQMTGLMQPASEQVPVGVNVKDVIDLTASKSAMYRALAVYGK
jgi:hypothetical protein